MKLPQLNKIKWNYRALAFAFPVIGILMVMLISGYTPFGNYSMLYSDMYHQYYPFFLAYRKALLSGESLLYSWNVGIGMDYLGLISYYLASPLNLLSVLLPESWMLPYFSLLVPVKLGLASLFFAIFLNKIFGKYDLSISLFGSFYGLCAWALGYQWNIMWLDTFALLPLVALGTIALIKDKKFVLYTLTLFLSIFSNYYIGLFTCIFVALLFFCYQICCCKSPKRFFADLIRIACFSAIAIGMTAILELPTLAALQTTQSSVNNFPSGFKMNIADKNTIMGLLDAMRQVAGNMCGGIEPSFKEGLPNLYCGISTIILAFLYLSTSGIKLREKLCCVGLLLFFMLSFILRQLDYIWHGFHFTNMIPYRFSFLFSFVLLYMAYQAWLHRKNYALHQVIGAGLLTLALILASDQRSEPLFLVYNLGFLVLYLTAACYGVYRKKIPVDAEEDEIADIEKDHKNRRKTAIGLLAGLMAVELVLNLVNFGICFGGTYVGNYPKGTTDTSSVIQYMKDQEPDHQFYRTEVTRTQTLNDGALNNYSGISTFTSSANVRITEFMKDLGYSAKNTYNRYCYEVSSPVADLFLNLKYLIDRDGNKISNPYYTDIYQQNEVHLLESSIYLPLGFLAEPSLADLDFEESHDNFAFQNQLFKTATGLDNNVWHLVPGSDLEIVGSDVEITSQSRAGQCQYETSGTDGGSVTYRYAVTSDGFMCLVLDLPARNNFTVQINGEEIYSDKISLPQMTAVGQVTAGDVVELQLTCKKDEDNKATVTAAILDDTIFRQGYDILSASTMELSVFRNTLVKGTVHCNRDGLLYTSIPQNGNWTATVDGKPAEIKLVGNVMIGLELAEGTHNITFTYHNAAFSLGWKISLLCTLIFGSITCLAYLPRHQKGRYQQ